MPGEPRGPPTLFAAQRQGREKQVDRVTSILSVGWPRHIPGRTPLFVASLERVGAGLITKVFVAFEEAFWAPNWSFWIAGRPRVDLPLWVDASQLAGRPMLCAHATGPRAQRVERLGDDELCELAWTTLRDAGVIDWAG